MKSSLINFNYGTISFLPIVETKEISGEIFNGLALNINSKNDLSQLDVIISEG